MHSHHSTVIHALVGWPWFLNGPSKQIPSQDLTFAIQDDQDWQLARVPDAWRLEIHRLSVILQHALT